MKLVEWRSSLPVVATNRIFELFHGRIRLDTALEVLSYITPSMASDVKQLRAIQIVCQLPP